MSSSNERVKLGINDFLKEALFIVEEANKKNIHLRILGALAVYLHIRDNPTALGLLSKLGRVDKDTLFTDLDLMGYSKQRKDVSKFFEQIGYFPDRMINTLFGNKRMIFYHPKGDFHVDVFFDKLEFSHDVIFGNDPSNGRLSLDYPTISLTDLVLEKIQINKINRKDLVDLLLIFASHDLVTKDTQNHEEINAEYIASILSDDWGFWYDAVNNLNKLKNFANNLGEIQNEYSAYIQKANENIDKLLKIIEEKPKSKNWIKRSKDGVNKPWYREVEEVVR
ncbi:MAG TPA: hypothetical protein VKU94_02185 [Geobacterales bacterium]|nr:hypothetical protein [Geobacterales bacterium]